MTTTADTPTAPTLGADVIYTLSDYDAKAINQLRADHYGFVRSLGGVLKTGHQGHQGNSATAGDTCPAKIVKVFGAACNLQVFNDGNDTYWATSRTEGDGEGHWIYRDNPADGPGRHRLVPDTTTTPADTTPTPQGS